MAKDNEVVGPKLWMWRNKSSDPWHITGGYSQTDHQKTLCGNRNIPPSAIVYDPRDIVPYKGMTDMKNYCLNCLNMMTYEAMAEQILFSQIKLPNGKTFGEVNLTRYLNRKSPKIELNDAPPLKDANSAKSSDVSGSTPPKKYKLMLKSQLEKKEREKRSRSSKKPKRSRTPKRSNKPKIDKGSGTTVEPTEVKTNDKTKSAAQIIGPRRVLGDSRPNSTDDS